MNQPPPLAPYQEQIDASNLKLLAIFHYISAGLSLLGLLFIIAHYAIMRTVFASPEIWKKSDAPPFDIIGMMKWFYLALGLIAVIFAIINLLSGLYIQQRKNRPFSLVVAGINCIHMPLGTVLGVFTIVVLIRDSVVRMYSSRPAFF